MRIRRVLVPLALVACAALTSCGDGGDGSSAEDAPGATEGQTGGSGDSGNSGDSPEACDLLTTDDVAAAVGSPVKEGLRTSGPAAIGGDFSTCVWQSADQQNPGDTATLTIYDNADAADSVRSDNSLDLEGIGDQAFSDSVSSVWVYDDDRSFFAQWYVFATMDDEGLEQSKALAKAAADAL